MFLIDLKKKYDFYLKNKFSKLEIEYFFKILVKKYLQEDPIIILSDPKKKIGKKKAEFFFFCPNRFKKQQANSIYFEGSLFL